MSRNLRQKNPMTPVKKTKRKPAKPSVTSDDDDYDAVDEISDSDEDEPDVERVERQAIIDEDVGTPSRPFDYDESSWEGFVDSPLDHTFFDDHISRGLEPDADTAAWNAAAIASSDSESTVTPRRVRFNLDNSDDESEIDFSEYPDPCHFLDQDSLNPKFRQRIEQDNDNDDASSDGGRWAWDESESSPTQSDDHVEVSDIDSDSDSSGGYDSDDDETDEDIPEGANAPARAVFRRSSDDSDFDSDSDSDTSTEDITVVRPFSGPTPKLGTWKHDRSKPFVMYDGNGKNLLMFRVPAKRRVSFNSARPLPLPLIPELPMDMSPMLSNSANLMMSGMASIDRFGAGPAIGPPEAFYPFTSISSDGLVSIDSDSVDEDDLELELDSEDMWDVNDIIEFGSSSSGEDNDPSPSSDTAEPSTGAEKLLPLYNHFQNQPSTVVGSFRAHQNMHQLTTRGNVSADSLAFSGPFQNATLRGIKGGRFAEANKSITPRRKTLQQPIASSPGSPLANAGKRKYGGEEGMGHKRHKSVA